MRLDAYLCEKKYFDSRTKAKRAVEEGRVIIDGVTVVKPSYEINEGASVSVKKDDFVSVGGYKLEKALSDFNFSVENLVAADLGASTGGFTHCLLKNGAKKVYAIDLNDELLSEELKKDEKVVSIIKNARYLNLNDFNEQPSLVVGDLSFISLTKIVTIMSDIICENGYIIALIKPQFENEGKKRFKNGIIKDEKTRISACKKIYDFAVNVGLSPLKITEAPIKKEKNREYLILIKKVEGKSVPFENIFI